MQQADYLPFTLEMKKDYTILIPTMLPRHFRLIAKALASYGYKVEVLDSSGPQVVEAGLGCVHNDACYPAVLVIGQFLAAIRSGRYDTHHLALMLFQTGGGCRASNYIPLLRKALERAGYAYIPVISFSLHQMETHPGFTLTLPRLRAMLYGVLYGDLLLTLVNQVKPYEDDPGAAERLASYWTERLGEELGTGKLSRRIVRENYECMIRDFAAIPRTVREAVQVGIVGEIFVKYSPLGNNDLESFLVGEGAEVTTPGLLDFCIYSVSDGIHDHQLYGRNRWSYPIYCAVYRLLCRKKRQQIEAIEQEGSFRAPAPFEEIVTLSEGFISHGAKMGEGWLLTAEMLELVRGGVRNIVCTQPFGCLPNHICGKGMLRPIREAYPEANIVAIDYDPGATRVNQENRLKLMLAQARRELRQGA